MAGAIVLGVSGGIAAYKAVLLLRLLREDGSRRSRRAHGRRRSSSSGARRGRPSPASRSARASSRARPRSSTSASAARPTSSSSRRRRPTCSSRAATGRADDLLRQLSSHATCPVLLAPAMHTEMWQHPATGRTSRPCAVAGCTCSSPRVGPPHGRRLRTGAPARAGDRGRRRPRPPRSHGSARPRARRPGRASHRGHRGRHPRAARSRSASSATARRGARASPSPGQRLERDAVVHLVVADVTAPLPDGIAVERVEHGARAREAVRRAARGADVVVMAAAVADYRPATIPPDKIKKDAGQPPAPIVLVENPDILAELVSDRAPTAQLIVGFAAETGDDAGAVLEHGRGQGAAQGRGPPRRQRRRGGRRVRRRRERRHDPRRAW